MTFEVRSTLGKRHCNLNLVTFLGRTHFLTIQTFKNFLKCVSFIRQDVYSAMVVGEESKLQRSQTVKQYWMSIPKPKLHEKY